METAETDEDKDETILTSSETDQKYSKEKNVVVIESSSSHTQVRPRESDPVCRICFRGNSTENLLSPCFCRGTIAYVHRNCLENWLAFKEIENCDVCQYEYVVRKTQRRWIEFFTDPATKAQRRLLLCYVTWAIITTPFMALLVKICIEKCGEYVEKVGGGACAAALASLATLATLIHVIYLVILLQFIFKVLGRWKRENLSISLELCPRHSATDCGKLMLDREEAAASAALLRTTTTTTNIFKSCSSEAVPLLPRSPSATATCSKTRSYSSIES